MNEPYVVAVVWDAEFGERLLDVAARFDTWVVPSSINRATVESVWRTAQESPPATRELTIWSRPKSADELQDWLSILFDIENHHGEHAHQPPVTVLEIFGGELTAAAKTALGEYGYRTLELTPSGFRATRMAAA